jgi:hypothetical protein
MVRLTLLFLLLASPALAHDHERPDLDEFYRSLMVPYSHNGFVAGSSCCNKTDCAPRPVRLTNGIYEAQGDNGEWLEIPIQAIITDKENPYMQAVICILGGKINCAVLGRTGG